MSISKLNHMLLKRITVTPLMTALLLASCGGEEKPDLGPRRAPRDNAMFTNPAPPPKVNPLIPGYDIPAPRFRTPMMIDQPGQGSPQPPVPPQSGLIYAPSGTVSMGGFPTASAPMPAQGRRMPAQQFAGVPPVIPPMAQAPQGMANTAPSSLPTWQPPGYMPGSPGEFQPAPIQHPAPRPVPVSRAPQKAPSFWERLTGAFQSDTPSQASTKQRHVLSGKNTQGTVPAPQPQPAFVPPPLPAGPMTQAEEAAALDSSVEIQVLDDQAFDERELPSQRPGFRPGPVVVPAPSTVKEDPAHKTGIITLPKLNMPKAVTASPETKKPVVVKQPFAPKTKAAPEALQPQPSVGNEKNILDLIEERRQYYGYSPSSAENSVNAEPALKTQPVSLQQKPAPAKAKPAVKGKPVKDEVMPWLDMPPESSVHTPVSAGAGAVATPGNDTEVLVEFEIDDTGNMVGIPGGAANQNKTAAP